MMVYKIQYKNRCLNLSVSQLLLTNVENVPAHISMKVREKTLAKAVTNGDKRTPGTHGSRFRRKPKQKTAYKIMSLYYVVKG